MELAWRPEDEAFRAELIAFLDAHTPAHLRDHGYDFGDVSDDHDLIPRWMSDWQATLFDHGWMIPGYPPELGGRNCTPVQTLIYLETMAGRRIPRAGHFPGYAIVAPSLLEFGNDEQKRLAPAAIRGDTVWCIGMSEPNAGSDLAGLQTRAEVYDDHFVVNGQKVWTSYATIAEKCFLYVRTRPDGPEAQGHLPADRRHRHARHRRAAVASHQWHRRIRRGVPHRSGRPAREPRRRAERRVADHAGIAGPRARGTVGRGGRAPRTDGRGPRRARPALREVTTIRSFAERSRRSTSSHRRCARSGTRGSRRSRRARPRPSTRT